MKNLYPTVVESMSSEPPLANPTFKITTTTHPVYAASAPSASAPAPSASAPAPSASAPAPPASPAPPSNANSKYVKRGASGCVLNPALPNNVEGVRTAFPGDVTKLFFKKDTYEKALLTRDHVTAMLGDESHRVTPYVRTIRGSNLSASIQTDCRIKPDDPLFPVRMPYLGRDISDIQSYYKQIQIIPIETILEQILKITSQVKHLFESGYIHGDIRELNVMIHPITGTMTIIDFDYLNTKKDFLVKYGGNFGFYSNPPESMLLRLYQYGEQDTIFNKYHTTGNILKHTKFTKEELNDAIVDSREWFVQQNLRTPPALANEILKTFDSYGLGLALDWLLYLTYTFVTIREPTEAHYVGAESRLSRNGTPYDRPTLQRIFYAIFDLKQVVKEMVSLKIRSRINILEAHARIRTIVEAFKGPAGGRRNTRKHLRKSKLLHRV